MPRSISVLTTPDQGEAERLERDRALAPSLGEAGIEPVEERGKLHQAARLARPARKFTCRTGTSVGNDAPVGPATGRRGCAMNPSNSGETRSKRPRGWRPTRRAERAPTGSPGAARAPGASRPVDRRSGVQRGRPGSPRCTPRLVEVARRLRETRGLATEVVYVDDGSRDATLAVAQGLPAEALDVQVVVAVAQFRQGGGAARRASTMRGSAPCCSWTATASIRPTLVEQLVATGSMTATTSSTPPRRTARTNPGCGARASRCSIADQLAARGRRFPRTPATSACSRRAPRRRCGSFPSATASSRGSRAGSASGRSGSTTSRPIARTAAPPGTSIR